MTPAALRRVVHAATIVVVPIGDWIGWERARTAFVVVIVLAATFEFVRLKLSFAERFVPLRFLYRAYETDRPSGAYWLVLGYGLAAVLFPTTARIGIGYTALVDPLGAAVGSRYSERGEKTVAGSLTVFLAGFAALALFGIDVWWAVVLASVGAILERFPGPFNDNAILPPAMALLTWLLLTQI